MSVSVIIPTKDEEKIFKTLEKTRDQNPDEIIVVNDSESKKKYAQKLKDLNYIEYVEAEGGGPARARNLGAEKANSNKIIFLDADCYPTENWLNKMEEALEENDLVEGEVEYLGERCRFSRVVENRNQEGIFLTANLGVKKKVFDQVQFDEEYGLFREDSDFGFRALNKGFTNTFVDAKVMHDAGKLNLKGFVKDQLRYDSEPYFIQKFKQDPKLEKEIRKIGPVLYPIELGFTATIILSIVATIIFPPAALLLLTVMVGISTADTIVKLKTQDINFCFKDWLKGTVYLPIGLIAKRYAIWKGAINRKVFVI